MSAACDLCELEVELRARSGEIRRELQKMNPVIDPNYDRLFQALVYADHDLRMLRGQARGQRRRLSSGEG
jgi:hypothetical protein